MIKVLTNGVFDLFHYGHLYILKEAKAVGDYLIVGINTDASIKRLKGNKRPIIPENYRYEIVSSIKYVDEVYLFDEDTPYELIKKIKPDYIVKGMDYESEDVVGNDISKVHVVPLIPELSTTMIIDKIRHLYNDI